MMTVELQEKRWIKKNIDSLITKILSLSDYSDKMKLVKYIHNKRETIGTRIDVDATKPKEVLNKLIEYLKTNDDQIEQILVLNKYDLFENNYKPVDLLPISVNISADNTEVEKLFNAYDLSKNNYAVPIIIFEQLMTRQDESEKQAYKTLMIRALKHPTMDKAEFMKVFLKNYEKYTTEKDRMSPYGTSISGYVDNHLLNVYSVGIKVLANLDPDIEKIISLHNEFDLF